MASFHAAITETIRQELSKIGIEVETCSADLGGWLKTIYTNWGFDLTSSFVHNYSDPSIGSGRNIGAATSANAASLEVARAPVGMLCAGCGA